MYEYYRVLDLPSTATQEEITVQFERLVRIYEPSRIDDEQDRAFAENKLKELAEAYRVLNQGGEQPTENASPRPVVDPGHLDFGTVVAGERVTQQILIDNVGGAAHSLNYKPGEDNAWYRLGKVERLSQEAPLPVRLNIEANSAGLPTDWSHTGWIDVILDGIVTRVTLELRVIENRRMSMRIGWLAATSVLALIILAWLSVYAFRLMPDDLGRLFASSPSLNVTLDDQFVLTSIVDSEPMLHVSDIDGEMIESLGIAGRDPAYSPVARQIAFTAPVGNHEQLFLLAPGSGAAKQMTSDTGNKSSPRWSSDGKHVAFLTVAEDADGERSAIRVLTDRGRSVSAFDTGSMGSINSFMWSPDGSRIVASSDNAGALRVYLVAVNADDSRMLTSFDTWDPAWSPDGSRISVASERGIYTLSPSGDDLRRLNVQPAHSPAWSADGTQIAFLSDWNNPPGIADLWRIDKTGGKAEQVTHGGRNVVNLVWLPNDLGLAYVVASRDEELSVAQLWMQPLEGEAYFVANVSEPAFAWLDQE